MNRISRLVGKKGIDLIVREIALGAAGGGQFLKAQSEAGHRKLLLHILCNGEVAGVERHPNYPWHGARGSRSYSHVVLRQAPYPSVGAVPAWRRFKSSNRATSARSACSGS